MTTEQMNAPRSRFLGGSDAACVMGVSVWKTPLQLYLEKRGEAAPRDDDDEAKQKLFRRGKRMEPIAVDTLIDEYGIKVTKRSTPENPNRYTDPEFPFLAAEIDFEWEVTAGAADTFGLPAELVGTIQNGEAKSVHQFAGKKFGEEETDEVPIEYAAQALHGLMVTPGRRVTLFAVMIGLQLVVYFVWRDEEVIGKMRPRLVKFWTENVLAGIPPEPINVPDVNLLFGRREPAKVECTNEIAKLVQALAEARAAERGAKEEAEDLKFRIGKFMLGEKGIVRDDNGSLRPGEEPKPGKHLLVWAGHPILSVGASSKTLIDSTRLRKLFPEVAKECTRTSTSITFRIEKEKKR